MGPKGICCAGSWQPRQVLVGAAAACTSLVGAKTVTAVLALVAAERMGGQALTAATRVLRPAEVATEAMVSCAVACVAAPIASSASSRCMARGGAMVRVAVGNSSS